jgi:putative ABC transport system permease protein
MEVIYGVLEQGLIYGLVGMAIFLTLRVIDFPDMGVNSTFTLGAAVWFCATKMSCGPILSSVLAFFAGAIAGYITATLKLFFNIRSLLAGIITMIALYSVNMRLMGRPNIPLMHIQTVFSTPNDTVRILILCGIVVACFIFLSWFFLSEIGLGIRVSGHNYMLGETYGVSKIFTVGTIVSLSNGIVALSGALLGQLQGFIDINMGTGVLIMGLVSVIIGEKILSSTKIYVMIFMSIIGAILYKVAVTLALFSSDLGLQSSDIYIITALMMVSMMIKKNNC